MKHLFTLLLALLLPLFSYADDSGTCGENLTYTYEEGTQTLTITGHGKMSDYADMYRISREPAPWHQYRTSIKKILVAGGITSIGDYAFYGCSVLSSIVIPNSVTCIGEYSFLK